MLTTTSVLRLTLLLWSLPMEMGIKMRADGLSGPGPRDPAEVVGQELNPIFYTLDVLVPFADFGQRDLWNSTFGREVFKVILAIFGWTLAITAIAGINRKLTRL
ncbi:MAG: hypothetical protein ACRDTJ_24520 [Pseudonocardiaceae bacterium]